MWHRNSFGSASAWVVISAFSLNNNNVNLFWAKPEFLNSFFLLILIRQDSHQSIGKQNLVDQRTSGSVLILAAKT